MTTSNVEASVECETLSLRELSDLLGLGDTIAYELAAKNELPVPVFKIGRKYFAFRDHYEEFKESQLKARHSTDS